ncbi:hypothetical protein [Schumannella sp. 10F1B-5-1]|uniref:hypothetical protein n=1 Tax=Schumannella sp. 10F1B-5-1 TaxID=2590780 RepID=UPI001131E819|nr:hypothetical protein [Schumannella sp. 10F1B-5-1]TPW72900.1 hypothetical protein FJ658_06480 [Schumannella sp. 10F1B-5-1]
MASKSSRRPLSRADALARLAEAEAYLQGAELLVGGSTGAEAKAAAGIAVLAGVAAADAICGLVLGEHSSGDDHGQAVKMAAEATRPATKAGNSLRRLLSEKTPVQYGVQRLSSADALEMVKWATDVVEEARRRAM